MTAPDAATLKKLAQLDDELQRRATALIRDCPYPVGVNSSWRSSKKQAELYAKYLNGGNLAAKPGTSNHEKVKNGEPSSLAVDFNYRGSKAATNWVLENAPKYGLHFPVRGENWHAEMTKTGPRINLDPAPAPRPKTNVPTGTSPLLGLKNPRLYGPKVADVQRVLVKIAPTNRSKMGDEVDLAAYGPKTAALMELYKKNRGLEKERGVTPAVWTMLRKDARS